MIRSSLFVLLLAGCPETKSIPLDGWDKDSGGDTDDTSTHTGDSDDTATHTGETGDDTGIYADLDGDGYDERVDCDDSDASVHPDAIEACNGHDDDCDGDTDEAGATGESTWYADEDGDGYGDASSSSQSCDQPLGTSDNAEDCNDDPVTGGDYHPGADESDCLDPEDYNCDGSGGLDDFDLDGFAACEECDDGNAAVNPDAAEVCNEVDDDCNGDVDEDDAGITDASSLYVDSDGDGYGVGSLVVTCDSVGYSSVDGDCDDSEVSAYPGAGEVCDSADIDENCDGVAEAEDSAGATIWHRDDDGDGYGVSDDTVTACDAPSGYVTTASGDEDCDDGDASVNVAATEDCNGYDDNCDEQVDELGATGETTWYADVDGDGYGDAGDSKTSCDADEGYIADSSDCDDGDAGVNPGATETCDGGFTDEDCDGYIDDDDSSVSDAATWYADSDSDGYGDSASSTTACEQPSGYSAVDGDCDDTYNDAYPGNVEWCDGVDNDCDGSADNGDADADGYDVCADCDESSASVNPGEAELCDGVDNDCDSSVDEDDATDVTTWYADGDGDGYGDDSTTDVDCYEPSGYVDLSGDCDDLEVTTYPGASETIADGVDSDCDGYETCYYDGDDDGYLDGSGTTVTSVDGDCSDTYEADSSASTDDCDDTEDSVNPGATENSATVWDDDCDGYAHDDGTSYSGTVENGSAPTSATITFTGTNWLGDVVGDYDSDVLFYDATLGTAGASGVTVWEVYEDSTGTFSTSSLEVDNVAWTSSLAGTYPGLQVLRGASAVGTCFGVEFSGLTGGDQYAYAQAMANTDTSAVTVRIFTYTEYLSSGGVNEMVSQSISAGTDTLIVGGFEAQDTTERVYTCARPTAGTLSLAHPWFSEASW